MTTSQSEQNYLSFINQALQSDAQTESYEEQRDAIEESANAAYEDLKAQAVESASSLLPLGVVELGKSATSLYSRSKRAIAAVQKAKAESDAKAAKISSMKDDAFQKHVDQFGDQALDKEKFMQDADKAIREKEFSSYVSKARSAVADKLNPLIDEATSKATSTIDALGSRADETLNRVSNAVESGRSALENKFAQFKDVATRFQQDAVDNLSKFQGRTTAQLDDLAKGASTKLEASFNKFRSPSGELAPELQSHYDAINSLISQKTPESLATAGALYKNFTQTADASKLSSQVATKLQAIDDAVATRANRVLSLTTAHQNKLESLNATKDQLQSQIDTLSRTTDMPRGSGTILEDLGATKAYRGTYNVPLQQTRADVGSQLASLRTKLDAKNSEIASTIQKHGKTIDDLNQAHERNVGELRSDIAKTSEQIQSKVGEQAESILGKIKETLSTAREGIAPVGEVLSKTLAPLSVFEGAISAQSLLTGKGSTTDKLMDLTNVKFGASEAKGIVEGAAAKIKGVIGGEAAQKAQIATEEQAQVAKEIAQQGKPTTESIIKSAGTKAGEDIAENIGKEVAEKASEEGVAAGIASSIPVVGEISDVALGIYSVIDSLKNLFTSPSKPKPPPQILSSVQLTPQAGVF
jgi:hypothetical protein